MLSRTEIVAFDEAKKYLEIHMMEICQARNANHPTARNLLRVASYWSDKASDPSACRRLTLAVQEYKAQVPATEATA